jgi:hypothetical protein
MATIPPDTGYSSVSENELPDFPVPASRQIPAEASAGDWRRPAMETALQCYAEAVGRTLGLFSRASADLLSRVRGYTQDRYSEVERETKNLGRRAQQNASYVRERYPLEALGAIAGTAFLVGIALRVWRSKSS